MSPGVSIVMPAFNEAQIIGRTLADCHSQVLSRFPAGEIIVVDDCSTDSTWDILCRLSKSYGDCMRPLRNERNLGHGPSLIRGLREARHECVFAIDSDYQHLPQDFWRLFHRITEHHVVIGRRKRRMDPAHRLILSKGANMLATSIFHCPFQDMNIPFKLFRRDCLDTLLPFVPDDFKVPSILLVALAHKMGFKVAQEDVTHLPRVTGNCSLRYLSLMSFCFGALVQLIDYRMGPWKSVPSISPDG